MHPVAARILFLCFHALIIIAIPLKSIADTQLPQYNIIMPNVDFWVKVYSKYATTQAIIHDSYDLDIIYEIIPLEPANDYSASKLNHQRMEKAKEKYCKILKELASNPNNGSEETRRVANLFGNTTSAKTYQLASSRIRCQIGQSNRFKAGVIRSGAYEDEIRAIFKGYDLPEALAYLPHVESSFDYKAYSKFGAAGIWQFTRSTGQRYMKVDYVLDERRDPIIATHAAANLLKDNYEKLGSWPLAITAYNHGAAGIMHAKKKYPNYPMIFSSYHSRTFKFASRNFYPEFLAAYHVASNYKKYFGAIELDRPTKCQTIPMQGYVSLKKICNHFNISEQTAQTLNPALRSPVFQSQKLVPKDYLFRLPYDIVVAALPLTFFESEQKPSYFYTVQQGDTAGRIARQHGVKLSNLILANNLSQHATIYLHQTLRIPVHSQSIATGSETPAMQPASIIAAAKKQNEKNNKTEISKLKSYPKPILASIIPSDGEDTSLPQEISDVPPDNSVEIVSADVRFDQIVGHTPRLMGKLQAEIEETLGHYAEWAGVRTQEIRQINHLPFGKTLHLHQTIKIPLKNVTAQNFEQSRYEFHKRLQEDFFAAYRISEFQTYQVKQGDNLWRLCFEKFDIPMWLLKNCNPEVDFAELRLNQTLIVPNIEKRSGEQNEITAKPPTDAPPKMVALSMLLISPKL